jgi:asparagine synthase (glutamine-hydrolysing)
MMTLASTSVLPLSTRWLRNPGNLAMSGIVGILNPEGLAVDQRLLTTMTEHLAYRGPDAQDMWLDGQVGFGHTMLRTTFEQATERQPCSLDGQVWITADARVDGRQELKQKLETNGRNELKTATDVELILHAYHVWGEDCVDHLLGDFAFAIWDGRQGTLFCARDHFGVKPFFYAQKNGTFIFSSDLNCLRLHPLVSDELNELAIADFLMFGENQEVDTSAFVDIRRLSPAHILTFRPGEAAQNHRYWSLPISEPLRYERPADYVERFRQLFRQAVSDRLRTDRVGIWMSGGLDSTSVAAVACRLMKQGPGDPALRAYTIVYDRLIPDQERYYSGEAASFIGIPIKYQVADDYPRFSGGKAFEDGRFRAPEPVSLSLREMWLDFWRQHWTGERVMLTGYGGDPALYPESRYFIQLVKRMKLGQFAIEVARFRFSYRRLPPLYFGTWWRMKRGTNQYRPSFPEVINRSFADRVQLLKRWQEVYARWNGETVEDTGARPVGRSQLSASMWPYLFEGYDPVGCTPPLETRHPFFDVRLISYMLALPPVPWCVDKTLLREAMVGCLSEEIRLRPKAPLAGHPQHHIRPEDIAEWVKRTSTLPAIALYCNMEQAVKHLSNPPTGSINQQYVARNAFSLAYWLQTLAPPDHS